MNLNDIVAQQQATLNQVMERYQYMQYGLVALSIAWFNQEEQRHIKEKLTEEELAMFDILTKPRVDITAKEEREVKKVAKAMLHSLKAEKLVLDWRKRQQSRAMVRLCIEEYLDKLPPVYTPDLYRAKCDAVYQHVYDSFGGAEQRV